MRDFIKKKKNLFEKFRTSYELTSDFLAGKGVYVLVPGGPLHHLPEVRPSYDIRQPVPRLTSTLVPASPEPVPVQRLALEKKRERLLLHRGINPAHFAFSRIKAPLDARVGLDEPRVGLDEPRVGLDEPRVGLDEPRVGLDEPRVRLDEPRVRLAEPRVRLAE